MVAEPTDRVGGRHEPLDRVGGRSYRLPPDPVEVVGAVSAATDDDVSFYGGSA
jgi:hypothetical protein